MKRELRENIHACDGLTTGSKHFCWPIPSRSSGKWYKRQWFWWVSFFKKIRCAWLGCVVKWNDYDYSENMIATLGEDRSFVALECCRKGGCGGRFVIFYKDLRIK